MHRNATAAIFVAAAMFVASCGTDDVTTTEGAEGTVGTDESQAESAQITGEPADGATRLWIKPELAECVGVAPQMCMEVAESENGTYGLFYDSIDGFTHEAGISYVIDTLVEEVTDPPADASSVTYTLIGIVEQSPAG